MERGVLDGVTRIRVKHAWMRLNQAVTWKCLRSMRFLARCNCSNPRGSGWCASAPPPRPSHAPLSLLARTQIAPLLRELERYTEVGRLLRACKIDVEHMITSAQGSTLGSLADEVTVCPVRVASRVPVPLRGCNRSGYVQHLWGVTQRAPYRLCWVRSRARRYHEVCQTKGGWRYAV